MHAHPLNLGIDENDSLKAKVTDQIVTKEEALKELDQQLSPHENISGMIHVPMASWPTNR